MTEAEIAGLVGVYHANGSLRGEAAYALGKLFGTAHCALCDITHFVVRRKPEWDAMVERFGVPVELLHLDELPDDVADACRVTGTPVVLAAVEGAGLLTLLDAGALDELNGSVAAFEAALVTAAGERGLRLR